MHTLLLTNDDGLWTAGIMELYRVLRKKWRVMVTAPGSQRSGDGKALTFHKPLRVREVELPDGRKAYVTNGTPADALHIAIHVLKKRPDLVVSGINSGDNTIIHSLFTSGTIAAVLEATIMGIPGIAFSMDTHRKTWFSRARENGEMRIAAKVARRIVDFALKFPFPKEVDFLNVNFPDKITAKTEFRLTRLARFKYVNFVRERVDPNEVKYYWLDGRKVKKFDENTDSHVIYFEKAISITPVSLKSLEELGDHQYEYGKKLVESISGRKSA